MTIALHFLLRLASLVNAVPRWLQWLDRKQAQNKAQQAFAVFMARESMSTKFLKP